MRWQIIKTVKSQKTSERREEIIKQLLINRCLKTEKQQEDFFSPKTLDQLSLKEIGFSPTELKKAFVRIKKAIKKEEKIVVYGDYDTDGVCATAILWEALDQLGAKAMPFIPTREEGYGLKVARIKSLAKEEVKLIITVDQGIVQLHQVAYAQKNGVDVIVTDHHLPGKNKPKAKALIHTTRLAGAGVAWFFARELRKHFQKANLKVINMGLDLAAIGTITDMVKLQGANRCLVKFGLKELQKTKRLGLKALCDFASIDQSLISPYEVGFIIGPRLNAAGRMDDSMESLRLVCTRDENRAIGLAQKIDQNNRDRQDLMKQTAQYAKKLWLKQDGQSALIFVYHHTFEHGVVGLVASRLKDEFYRPAVVLAPRGDYWVGSARSIEEFSIISAIRKSKKIIGDHGGHKLAAGFSVSLDKIEILKENLIVLAEAQLDKEKLSPQLKIDCEVELTDLDLAFFRKLEEFAPFGQGNPQPVFATKGVKVVEVRTVGKENKHLKLRFASCVSRIAFDAIGFGLGHLYSQLDSEKPIDIAYNLMLDEWNGNKRLQLKLKDLKVVC